MTETLIRVHDLVKRYKRGNQAVEVLRHLDLEIAKGEFVALMGPSGSGKTTLLNLIGGLDRPTEGEIEIGGEPDRRAERRAAGQVAGPARGFRVPVLQPDADPIGGAERGAAPAADQPFRGAAQEERRGGPGTGGSFRPQAA